MISLPHDHIEYDHAEDYYAEHAAAREATEHKSAGGGADDRVAACVVKGVVDAGVYCYE